MAEGQWEVGEPSTAEANVAARLPLDPRPVGPVAWDQAQHQHLLFFQMVSGLLAYPPSSNPPDEPLVATTPNNAFNLVKTRLEGRRVGIRGDLWQLCPALQTYFTPVNGCSIIGAPVLEVSGLLHPGRSRWGSP